MCVLLIHLEKNTIVKFKEVVTLYTIPKTINCFSNTFLGTFFFLINDADYKLIQFLVSRHRDEILSEL